MDDRLLKEFLAEAEDLVEELYGDIAALRERRGDGPARRELIARIFRHVHTVKGTASAAGLDAASLLAHEFESLLDAVRSGRAPLDDDALEACEEAVGAVTESLGAAARGERLPVPQGLVMRLRRLVDSPAGAHADPSSDVAAELLPAELARALSTHERQRLREAVGEGALVYIVTVEFDLANFDEQYRRLSETLGEVGEVVSTQPFVNALDPDRVGFRIVYASAEERVTLEERTERFAATLSAAAGESAASGDADEHDSAAYRLEDDTYQLEDDAYRLEGNTYRLEDDTAQRQDAHQCRRDVDADQDDGDVDERDGGTLEVAALQSTSAGPTAAGVRVPLEELEDLISTTHELFADTVGALDFALAGGPAGVVREELEERSRGVHRRFFELEERLIGLRMVPLRVTLLRAERAGRSVARAAGKRVEFEMAGGDARLDRSLADRVADPLLHLVRNAVDHGIESEEERRAAGKPEGGRVRVEATTEGGLVVLRVSDDGRGVDTEVVARAAAAAGLVAPGARISEEQALRLIFRPGFSTAERASLVSGRGVGLDVVERAIENAGGEVRVRSERGRGTTFELRLPTTLALLPAHVVRSGGQRYCIGAGHVIESGEAERTAISREGTRRTLHWRGRDLPLVEIGELLGSSASEELNRPASEELNRHASEELSRTASEEATGEETRLAFFIARGRAGTEGEAEARAAVAVDALEGQSEVLVRGLGRHAKRWRGVGGATELRDGTVVLVLDLPRLLEALD
jgi:two-component system chemotaxis sensor kinase CheA